MRERVRFGGERQDRSGSEGGSEPEGWVEPFRETHRLNRAVMGFEVRSDKRSI
jgi:hypothetical protein